MTQQKKRLVLDTNTLVSAFQNETSRSASFYHQVKASCDLLISEETFLELKDVLFRPYFNKKFEGKEQRRDELLTEYIFLSTLVNISTLSTDCRDPKDNKFLSLALSGEADFIISGDHDLLVLNPYHWVRILTMREYADENGIIL
jgi:putative PIN family toxin of toxin-antitoxin system